MMTSLLTSQGIPKELRSVFLSLLSKPPKDVKASFITTAAFGDYKNPTWLNIYKRQLIKYGIGKVEELDIRGKAKRQLEEIHKDVEVIYINGGNTCFLLYYLRKTGFDKIIKEKVKRGVLYVGVSAGSIVMGPSIKFGKKLSDRNKIGLKDFTGLGLVPFTIYPHYKKKNYPFVKKEAEKLSYPVIVLNDKQAVFVKDNEYKVVGKGKKIIFNRNRGF